MSRLVHFAFLLVLSVSMVSCGGTVCKGVKRSVVLDFDPIFKTVDVGGGPTHTPNASWVKKLMVEDDGFLLVYDQKTAGFQKQPCEHNKSLMCDQHVIRSVYYVESYTKAKGYQLWYDVPKKDWQSLVRLGDSPPQKPHTHIKNCRFSLFGSLIDILLAMFFA